MKKSFLSAAIIVTMGLASSSFAVNFKTMYSDRRAVAEDDILTVYVVEQAKAGSQSTTNTSKKGAFGMNVGAGSGLLNFLPSFGASGANNADFDGKGATERQGSLVAKVSARVIKVLDNGNLLIEGSKAVEINNEKEVIKVSGLVRPEDIDPNNFIYSYNIADAQITYSGKGDAATAHRPGVVAQFFNWLF